MKECDDNVLKLVANKMEYDDLVLCVGDGTTDSADGNGARKMSVLRSWRSLKGADATYLSLVEVILSVCDRATADAVIEHAIKYSELKQ